MKKIIKYIFFVILGAILLLSYAHLESRWLKTKRIDIHSDEIPSEFDGKKVIFITDIHHGPFLSLKRVKKLVQRINKLNPDFVLLGGDYVHRDSKYIEPLFNEFKRLDSKCGVYGVLGNHDHWESRAMTEKMMAESGINICDNQSYWVKIKEDSIKIGGVGDLWEDEQIITKTTDDLEVSDFSILISHNPDYVENIEGNTVDLVLSGHTHGGQVTFFGFWAPVLPSKTGQKYRYGLKKFGNGQVYISSGVGTITPPLRFFCRPEIVEIILKKE